MGPLAREVSEFFRAVIPVGKVEAVRQEYQVFKTAGGDYLVFSPSSRGSSSFHMTCVSGDKVVALAKAVGKGDTSGSLMKNKGLEESFGSDDRVAMRFDLLMGMYILAASGRVTLERSGRNLVFSRSS